MLNLRFWRLFLLLTLLRLEVKEFLRVDGVNSKLCLVGEGDSVQGTAAPDLRSDPESDDEKAKKEGEGVKVSKKRKRRLISDSEGSEDEEKDAMNESEEDNDDADLGVIKKIDYDSDENPVVAKPVKNRMLTKGGKLRKDFVEGEAELSGSEEVKTFQFVFHSVPIFRLKICNSNSW